MAVRAKNNRVWHVVFLGAAALASSAPAEAASTKDQCVEAHGRGQDLREQKRLVRAKEQFLVCMQAGCPGPIQADCSKFLEQVDALVPSISFGARDDEKHDLPDTQVYLDGVLTSSRLDDGRLVEVDPGSHAVRFVRGGRELTMKVVLTPGDKGRPIIGVFSSPTAAAPREPTAPPPVEARPGRSPWPLVVAGLGAAALVGGGALFFVGMDRVPAECSVSSHTCAATPGDPSFERARSAVSMSNTGLGIGIAGLAVAAGSLAWYFALPSGSEPRRDAARITPWLAPGSGGVTVGGTL